MSCCHVWVNQSGLRCCGWEGAGLVHVVTTTRFIWCGETRVRVVYHARLSRVGISQITSLKESILNIIYFPSRVVSLCIILFLSTFCRFGHSRIPYGGALVLTMEGNIESYYTFIYSSVGFSRFSGLHIEILLEYESSWLFSCDIYTMHRFLSF